MQQNQTDTESTSASTETPADPTSAQFEFEYNAAQQQVTITYNGSADLTGGDLQIQQTDGKQVLWPELGSTVAGTDEGVQTGATAVLGPNILNWEQSIDSGTTIRVIFIGKDSPVTLGRFTPSETTSETTTYENVIDDFEDGDLATEWVDADRAGRDGFSVESGGAPEGDHALHGVRSSSESTGIARDDFTISTDGASIQFYLRLGPVLTGYQRANKFRLMAGEKNDDEQKEEVIMFDQKDRSRDPGDYTPPEGQMSTQRLASVKKVEVIDINFTENKIGEIRIGGEMYMEDVEFIAEHSEISRVRVDNAVFNNNTDVVVDKIAYSM